MNEIKGQGSGVNCHKQEARQKHWLWGVLGLAALAVILGLAAQGPATHFGQVGSVAGPGEGETVPATLTPPDAATQAQVSEAYGKLPLHFEANHGQTDARVSFLARGPGYTLFLIPTEAVLALRPPPAASPPPAANQKRIAKPTPPVLRLQFVGANSRAQVVGREELSGKSHYFLGNDPRKWRTNIPTYARVQYKDLYLGVDLLVYGTQRQLEFDIIVAPGADPRAIRLGFQGVDNLDIDAQGDLILRTRGSEFRQRKPFIYQEINGTKKTVPGMYVLTGKFQVGFQVAAYDPTKSLVIDPMLTYSTYLGGSDYDAGRGIAVDAAGNAYVTGETYSTNFPLANPFRGTFAGGDAFVTKLNATGSALVYSTYLGGSDDDVGHGIAVDGAGNAYVTGLTRSANFPAVNPFQRAYAGGGDAFVTKLNATGSALVYSTYLGGSDQEAGHGIAVDGAGNAYVTGWTRSANFPAVNAFQGTYGGGIMDAFVTKLNTTGSALVYSTYLGGSNTDFGFGIAVDAAGNAYVTGETESGNFPTANSLQPAFGGTGDAFVTKLNAAGSALVYSTHLGGSGYDASHGIDLDAAGNAYVTGWTSSPNFPTMNPFQRAYAGDSDAFVVKITERPPSPSP